MDEGSRSVSISDITAAAEIVENHVQVEPTADKYNNLCEVVDRYQTSLERWLSDITSTPDHSSPDYDTPMGNLPRIEKLALFQALLSVAGACADQIVDEEKRAAKQATAAGA